MFTGIIEALGKVKSIDNQGTNKSFLIESTLASDLGIDESLAHNGVCLTVEDISNGSYKVTAVKETLDKTTLDSWKQDAIINLERAMPINGRLDGHIVQGHVDDIVTCKEIVEFEGSCNYTFQFNEQFGRLVIEKGSVCVNGVSLTAFNVTNNTFTVTIIPYTLEHTNFASLNKGEKANIEFDILGKYVLRSLSLMKDKAIPKYVE
jgi:riboflavin synthase